MKTTAVTLIIALAIIVGACTENNPAPPSDKLEKTMVLTYDGTLEAQREVLPVAKVPVTADIASQFCDLPSDAVTYVDPRDGMRVVQFPFNSINWTNDARNVDVKQHQFSTSSNCQGSNVYEFVCFPQKYRVRIEGIPNGCTCSFNGTCVAIECDNGCPSRSWCCQRANGGSELPVVR